MKAYPSFASHVRPETHDPPRRTMEGRTGLASRKVCQAPLRARPVPATPPHVTPACRTDTQYAPARAGGRKTPWQGGNEAWRCI